MDKKIKGIHSERIILYLLVLLFWAGELTGTILCCVVNSDGVVNDFIYNRLYCTFIQTVINSFSTTFILIILCTLFGMGAFFQLFEAVIPFFYGLGIGMLLTEMNCSYGFKGLLYTLIMIVPYTIISAIIVIISAREALMMSNALMDSIFIKCSPDRKFDFNLYMTKFLLLIMIAATASIVDSIITYFFTGFWTDLMGVKI